MSCTTKVHYVCHLAIICIKERQLFNLYSFVLNTSHDKSLACLLIQCDLYSRRKSILGANENRPLIRNAPPKLGIGITLSKELPLPTNEIHGIFVQGIIKIPMMAQFTVHCVGTSYTTAYKTCLNFIFKLSQLCALYKKCTLFCCHLFWKTMT